MARDAIQVQARTTEIGVLVAGPESPEMTSRPFIRTFCRLTSRNCNADKTICGPPAFYNQDQYPLGFLEGLGRKAWQHPAEDDGANALEQDKRDPQAMIAEGRLEHRPCGKIYG